MLVKPRDPDSEDNYAPYLKSEISHIYNSFDSIIKINLLINLILKIKGF